MTKIQRRLGSGDREMAFVYTNIGTVNKAMAHEVGHK